MQGDGSDRRVIVVEDDSSMRQLICEFLELKNFRVDSFSSASEFISLLNSHVGENLLSGTRLILSDIQMPGLSGFDLLEYIKRTHPSVPVVLMSMMTSSDVIASSTCKAFGFFPKPFRLRDLAQFIENVTTSKSIDSIENQQCVSVIGGKSAYQF